MDDILGDEFLSQLVDLLVRLVEAAGAIIIFAGAIVAFGWFLVVAVRDRRSERFVSVRLRLGRFLALGLEFQLASDVLRTAISPTLRQLGELAAVAAIRTALNYFLARENREEGAEISRGGADIRRGDAEISRAGSAKAGSGAPG